MATYANMAQCSVVLPIPSELLPDVDTGATWASAGLQWGLPASAMSSLLPPLQRVPATHIVNAIPSADQLLVWVQMPSAHTQPQSPDHCDG